MKKENICSRSKHIIYSIVQPNFISRTRDGVTISTRPNLEKKKNQGDQRSTRQEKKKNVEIDVAFDDEIIFRDAITGPWVWGIRVPASSDESLRHGSVGKWVSTL